MGAWAGGRHGKGVCLGLRERTPVAWPHTLLGGGRGRRDTRPEKRGRRCRPLQPRDTEPRCAGHPECLGPRQPQSSSPVLTVAGAVGDLDVCSWAVRAGEEANAGGARGSCGGTAGGCAGPASRVDSTGRGSLSKDFGRARGWPASLGARGQAGRRASVGDGAAGKLRSRSCQPGGEGWHTAGHMASCRVP